MSEHAVAATLSLDEAPRLEVERLDGARVRLLVAGVAALGLAALGLLSDPRQLLHSYLTAYVYWTTLALGALFMVLVHHATKAGWSVTVRRPAEALATSFPLLALLFLPVLLGMHELYHWTHHDAVAADPVLAGKAGYLNQPFFVLRAIVYFSVWSALGRYFYRLSVAQDRSADPELTKRMEWWAPLGILAFALTLTFAAFDWLMSLDPHWYSTIWGVYVFAGAAVGGFALLGLVSVALVHSGAVGRDLIRTEQLHDLGKWVLAWVIFWAYIAFSQFMLQWYGNLPEETVFYHHRWHGGGVWRALSVLLIAAHFCLPFLFLLGRWSKRREAFLAVACGWMLVMHYVDIYWIVMPNYHGEAGLKLGTDLLTLAGIGCLVAAWVLKRLRGQALVPVGDPRLPEALRYDTGV
ncbi:MAG: membrane protein [Planctomycetota bacterium]|nr:MAG: membrane protein [Planctomycetota bacterium]